MNVLVIGGAGYIGSHCLHPLEAANHCPVVLDNLVSGHRKAVAPHIPFYKGDLGDYSELKTILKKEKIEAVMHFAAHTNVGESVTHPLKYYENNLAKPITLLGALLSTGVSKFIFSSTCAIFGVPQKLPLTEDMPKAPISPYGKTKLAMEQLLQATSQAHGLSFTALRYFNAAGANKEGLIGEDHDPETHLIPLAIRAALGQRGPLILFGRDYPTPDGTCLRDYIHVDDLAQAHVAALQKLDSNGRQHFYHLGSGVPHSVLKIITAVETVTGLTVPVIDGNPRFGDPPTLWADPSKAQRELGWELQYTDLHLIIETAYKWHKDHPNGFED